MQKLVSKYGLAAHLAFMAVAPLLLFPFCGETAIAQTLLWLTLSGGLWLFMEPSRHPSEMPYSARVRVAASIAKDPLTWIMLAAAVYALIGCLNGTVAVKYDPAMESWGVTRPAVPWLPGHAEGAGFLRFASILAAVFVIAGCRHALGKSARVAFLFIFSFLASLSAVAAIVIAWWGDVGIVSMMALDAAPVKFIGGAFGVAMLCGLVAFAGSFELKWNRLLILFSISIGGNAAGLFYFATPPVALLYVGLSVVVLAGCIGYLFFAGGASSILRFIAGVFISCVMPVALGATLAPQDPTAVKLAAITEWTVFSEGFQELRERLSEIAAAIWREHVWTGAGIGSFPLEARFMAKDTDWIVWGSSVPPAALNGWWQLVAERGIAGAILIALPLTALAVSWIVKAIMADFFKAFLPLCILGPLIACALAVEAFVSSSPLGPAHILAGASIFAIAAGAFPARKNLQNDGIPKKGVK